MPTVNLNDIELYYEEFGHGPPLVLIHGFSVTGKMWSNTIPFLAEKYRVIVPDLRGHGRSTGELETIHHVNFAADLLALLDALHIKKAHFVGFSSGGMSLLFVGTQKPERVLSLSLVSATYTYDDHARPVMLEGADTFWSSPERIAMSRQQHGEMHGQDCWKKHSEAFRNFALNPQELPFQPANLEQIPVPVLILHGDRDEFFPVYIPVTMYQSIPDVELCILPCTTHSLPAENQDVFPLLIGKFIERISEKAGSN